MIIQPQNKKNKKSSLVIKRKRSSKKKRTRLTKRLLTLVFSRFSFFIFLLLLLLGGLCYFLFASSQFQITSVKVEGISPELTEATLAHYKDVSSEKIFFFLRKNTTLLFPKKEFQVSALKAVPKIKDVKVSTELPHSLTITASERVQQGIWCNYHTSISVPKCYFYGTEGVIYEDAPNSARGTLITTVRDARKKDTELSDEVLAPEEIEYMSKISQALEVVYKKPIYISVHSDQEIRLGFSEGWEAYLKRSDPVEEQAENLALVLEKEIGERVGELEYVDMRLGNKVFYKYRDPE